MPAAWCHLVHSSAAVLASAATESTACVVCSDDCATTSIARWL